MILYTVSVLYAIPSIHSCIHRHMCAWKSGKIFLRDYFHHFHIHINLECLDVYVIYLLGFSSSFVSIDMAFFSSLCLLNIKTVRYVKKYQIKMMVTFEMQCNAIQFMYVRIVRLNRKTNTKMNKKRRNKMVMIIFIGNFVQIFICLKFDWEKMFFFYFLLFNKNTIERIHVIYYG